jgi:hypothetical protein
MDTLMTILIWLFMIAFCCAGAWGVYYYIRMKIRYYKSLAAEVKTYFNKG